MPLAARFSNLRCFQTFAEEFYLFACCHHIAMDGVGICWSAAASRNLFCAHVGRTLPACQLRVAARPDRLRIGVRGVS